MVQSQPQERAPRARGDAVLDSTWGRRQQQQLLQLASTNSLAAAEPLVLEESAVAPTQPLQPLARRTPPRPLSAPSPVWSVEDAGVAVAEEENVDQEEEEEEEIELDATTSYAYAYDDFAVSDQSSTATASSFESSGSRSTSSSFRAPPPPPPPPRRERTAKPRWKVSLAKAWVAMKGRNFDGALDDFEAAIGAADALNDPALDLRNDARVLFAMAKCCAQMEWRDESCALLRSIIELPGVELRYVERADRALASFERSALERRERRTDPRRFAQQQTHEQQHARERQRKQRETLAVQEPETLLVEYPLGSGAARPRWVELDEEDAVLRIGTNMGIRFSEIMEVNHFSL